ncbi:MAG: hypothetical protein J6P16_02215, partial [Eubacterium sp.]|nr:hypothetical protein [Eubacterium sp.]
KDEDIGIFDDSGDIERAACISDAFFGDAGILMNRCRSMGKPVMWATPGTPVEEPENDDRSEAGETSENGKESKAGEISENDDRSTVIEHHENHMGSDADSSCSHVSEIGVDIWGVISEAMKRQ